jgi:hypothetical protein
MFLIFLWLFLVGIQGFNKNIMNQMCFDMDLYHNQG